MATLRQPAPVEENEVGNTAKTDSGFNRKALWGCMTPAALVILLRSKDPADAVPDSVVYGMLDAYGAIEEGEPDIEWARRELKRWRAANE